MGSGSHGADLSSEDPYRDASAGRGPASALHIDPTYPSAADPAVAPGGHGARGLAVWLGAVPEVAVQELAVYDAWSGRRWGMTNPQLLRLAEHLRRLKLFKIHERLDLLQEAQHQS